MAPIKQIIPAPRWFAEIHHLQHIPGRPSIEKRDLVCFALMDDGSVRGMCVAYDDETIDFCDRIEGFNRIAQYEVG